MLPEKEINDFVERLHEAACGNVESVILYGSAIAGDFHPEFSNVNLLCVLHDTSFRHVQMLSAAVNSWVKKGQPAPLLVTRQELLRSTDVFPIELFDMQQHYRVLLGEDVLRDLQVPMHLHRVQVEYELREKLLVLRRGVLIAGRDQKKLVDLLLRSVSSFATLFRHALIALGQAAPITKRDGIQKLAEHIKFDPDAVLQVLDVRERRIAADALNAKEVCARYLVAIEKVTSAVDEILDSTKGQERL
jgi:hypothetical protein